MIWSFLFGMIVVIFSIFGLVCAVQMLLELCFPLRQIVITVEILTEHDLELLDFLLLEARSASLCKRSVRLGVLLSESLCRGGRLSEDTLSILKKHRADCYLIAETASDPPNFSD